MSVHEALDRIWDAAETAEEALAGLEQEAWALRYAVLVVDRDAKGTLGEVARRLVHGATAMRGPGSPPMVLIAWGDLEVGPLDEHEVVIWHGCRVAPERLCAVVCVVPAGS